MLRVELKPLQALNETLKRLIKAHDEGDVATQRSILAQFVKHERAAYQRKLQLLTELKTLKLETRAAKASQEKLVRLVALYRFAADVRGIGQDQLDDRETYLTANRTLQEVYVQFEALAPEGMAALEKLLDDPSPNVRACAAFSLVATLPEKAIPVLEAIERSPGLRCAWLTADFALAKYRAEVRKRSAS